MKQVQISHDIVQLVIVQYRARTHPVTPVLFFQVVEKGLTLSLLTLKKTHFFTVKVVFSVLDCQMPLTFATKTFLYN